MMNNKNHYECLDISQTATKDEVKKEYRKLVLKYHPDTSTTKSKANAERFKQISAAYAVLSNEKERKIYDLELAEFKKFGRIRRPGGGGAGGPFGRQPGAGGGMAYRFHVLDGIYKPKNLIIGLTLGFATVAAIKAALGIEPEETIMQRNKREDGKSKMVEAWYNAKKSQWEQPSPWSKNFRDLRPEIKLVAREKVRPASSDV